MLGDNSCAVHTSFCRGERGMHVLPVTVSNYLAARGVKGPWKFSLPADTFFAGVVVIPALAEADHLLATLESIAANPTDCLQRHMVVVVVNNREDAASDLKEMNEKVLADLPVWRNALPLNLFWIDAATAGFELPVKTGGVGLARKIGMDMALNHLDFSNDPYIICLDADTIVDANYLPALAAHFADAQEGGAILPFVHQRGANSTAQLAIDRYELFLRAYVLGLYLAGSPYAFHTVGSAMACRAADYVRMGGMNTRQAAEDFYFLQQLHRISGVKRVQGTCVMPSPRESYRVPFGTGRSMTRQLSGDGEAVLFYDPRCFHVLRDWLQLVTQKINSGEDILLKCAADLSPELAGYLDSADFATTWERLCRHHPDHRRRLQAFHGWFDGLKTMKLVHHLSNSVYPRGEPEEAVPPLMGAVVASPSESVEENLHILREIQNGGY